MEKLSQVTTTNTQQEYSYLIVKQQGEEILVRKTYDSNGLRYE
jgi:hypothetical protein